MARRDSSTAERPSPLCHNRGVKFLRMKPGHGEVLIAEGDPEVAEEERELVEAFRRQLDQGLWAAVPVENRTGRPHGPGDPAGRRHARPAADHDMTVTAPISDSTRPGAAGALP